MRTLLIAALLSVGTLPLSAMLTFESPVIDVKAEPTATKQVALFKFTNTGDRPVTIHDVKTSCGCTTTKLDKLNYEPGESGEITATLDLGGRVGKQHKEVTVSTDDPAQQSISLKLIVEIPELIAFSSRGLVWSQGAPPTVQTIKVKVVHTEPIKIKEIKSNDAFFKIELHTIIEGREYEIDVTPTSTAERTPRSATIITDFPWENPKTFTLSLRVN
ncbi:MAG: DUF1573 domain-containing protein [Verrucomicrobiota bacterium]|nr:DUF1573 domain-containing protein [Verrucomicrobiota bacterium]